MTNAPGDEELNQEHEETCCDYATEVIEVNEELSDCGTFWIIEEVSECQICGSLDYSYPI